MKELEDIDSLIEGLNATDIDLNQKAQAELVILGDSVVDRLITVLQAGSVCQRINAVLVLGRIGDTRAVDSMYALSTDPRVAIRVSCASALGLINDPRIINFLVDWLGREKQAFVQSMIIKSLVDKQDKHSIGPLIDTLQQTENPCVRYTVIRALGDLGDPAVIELILPFANDEDYHVRQNTRLALEKLGYYGR